MKKIFAVLMIAFALVGCKAETNDISADFVLPRDISNCKVYALHDTNGGVLKALICPNATTATEWKEGKYTRQMVAKG